MLLFRRQLRGRIAELEKELSEMKEENAEITMKNQEYARCMAFCNSGKCIHVKSLSIIQEENATLKRENAELRVTNKGLASSVSELKAKIRAKKPGKETAR